MPYPEAIAHYPKSLQLFVKIVYNRIERGKNCLIPFIGQTGSGKSLSTISLMIALYLYRHGEMPSVDYIIDRVKFKALDVMKDLNNPNLKKKDVRAWEEAGVAVGHKSHASVQNRVVGWLVQTFRNLQQVVFFTVPSMSFLDASIRKMLHLSIETKTIDTGKNICIVKPLLLQYNERKDEIYYHNLSYPNEDGYYDTIDLMGVPLPPQEFIDAYLKEKNKFTKDLNLEIQATLQKIENKKADILTPRQEEVANIMKKGITNQQEIAEELGISQPSISKTMKILARKGVKKELYENIPQI